MYQSYQYMNKVLPWKREGEAIFRSLPFNYIVLTF